MAHITFCVTGGLSSNILCRTTLESTATVLDLKEEVQQAAGIPAQEQRLLLGTRVMRNGVHLEDLVSDSSGPVEVSVVRSAVHEDPQWRMQAFEQRYLHHGMHACKNRWEYHHANASIETDLSTGWSKDKQLFVKLHYDSSQEVTFNLCSLDFPLRELFDTFAEQLGVSVSDLLFFFQGKCLGREHTPHLCGMEPCSFEAAYTIDVERSDGQRQRQHLLAILNSMGDAVELRPSAISTSQVFPIGADNLMKLLMLLPLRDLLTTTLVSTFWFHATQRLSLMLQFRHGDLAFVTAPPQQYTTWLTSVFGHSQQLALAEARSRHRELEIWQGLNISKQKPRPAYSFTKAAGCTTMKTVSLVGLSAEFEQQWLTLHSSKAKFMAECKEWCKNKGPMTGQMRVHGEVASDQQEVQELPPPGVQNFSTEAVSPEFRAVAIEIFRRYFSPDMYFIFPLIVGKEALFGLDFRSTTTTLFFGPHHEKGVQMHARAAEEQHHHFGGDRKMLAALKGSSLPAPAGACSWRFRWPLRPQQNSVVALELEQPLPLLEVLFIAVWEEERYQVHGGSLVGELEAKARAAGVDMMYVEIGFEQPKARRFWRKQGFGRAVRKDLKEMEKEHLLEAEEHEDVPMPLVPLSGVQFDFFESNCLRFSDTTQYVKLLK